MLIYIFSIFRIVIGIVLRIVWFIFGKDYIKNIEKGSRFECGFDTLKKARVVFSLRFFLVIMLFLVFEIEIVLLIPLILVKLSIDIFSFSIIIVLLFIVLAGLLHEWNQGCLDWIFFSSI